MGINTDRKKDIWEAMGRYDIRDFLKDVIETKKKRNPRFSQRAFAYQLGFSPSTLNEIIKGKRPLSKKSIEKLKEGLSEDTDLHLYLENYQQDRFPLFQKEAPEVTAVATKWYYHALLELANTSDFQGDPAWLAQRLGISLDEVQTAIDQMIKHGELTKKNNGKLAAVKDSRMVVSTKESLGALVARAQSEQDKVMECVRDLPGSERFLASLIVAVAPEDFEYIRARMLDVVREYHKFLSREGVAKTEVFQLSFSCVPLTRRV